MEQTNTTRPPTTATELMHLAGYSNTLTDMQEALAAYSEAERMTRDESLSDDVQWIRMLALTRLYWGG